MFYQESFFRNTEQFLKNVLLALPYDLTVTEVIKSKASLHIYPTILQGEDIKLQHKNCFASDPLMTETTDTKALETLIYINNP